MKVVKKSWYP